MRKFILSAASAFQAVSPQLSARLHAILASGTLLVTLSLASCNDGDFVKHTLQAQKKGNCTGSEGEVNMVSNTNGERYQFDQCLPDGFTEKDCQLTRKGDTIVVSFPQAKGSNTASYQLVLDVDAKPRYHFIRLGNQLIAVSPTTPY